MGKYKICVYGIAKNEEHFVDRWVDSVKEADLIRSFCPRASATPHQIPRIFGENIPIYIRSLG